MLPPSSDIAPNLKLHRPLEFLIQQNGFAVMHLNFICKVCNLILLGRGKFYMFLLIGCLYFLFLDTLSTDWSYTEY